MLALTTPQTAAQWLHSRVTGTLQTDSRKVKQGDGFIAWPGFTTDGRAHVPQALANGASACLVEHDGVEAFAFHGDAVASYSGLKASTASVAAHYHGQPSHRMRVVAVTGTNGKTSATWWLARALSNIEHKTHISSGLIGTLGIGRLLAPSENGMAINNQPSELMHTGFTTPDPVTLQQAFKNFADAGVVACALEATSIGIKEHRLDATQIHTAVFTNFTQDHLDYHGSMQAYWNAKAELFAWPGLKHAVVNVDDAKGRELAANLSPGIEAWTVSSIGNARIRALNMRHVNSGLCFTVAEGSEQHELQTALLGDYNVSNLLCVMGSLRTLGIALADGVEACRTLFAVPGRMQAMGDTLDEPLVVVDYAHTPDALDKALRALKPLAKARDGQLVCVFGCGGDRDASKRPIMGALAAQHADRVIVTSDNPRKESPQAIISQILLGLTGFDATAVQPDRGQAIADAVVQASARDVVLIAGKGHETYQDVAGVKRPFSDIEQVARALLQRNAAPAGNLAQGAAA
jgi:UDP-N-acetylmuramyl-tripeptide synthetase